MYIVTGSSDNHFRSLLQFLQSIPTAQLPLTYVWDLGLTQENLHSLQSSFPSVSLRRFPFAEYSTYFNIDVAAGQYAWKPVAIWRTALELTQDGHGGCLLWCDAGNRIVGDLGSIAYVIASQGIYSPISSGTVKQWTHSGCLNFLDVKDGDTMLGMPPRNGAIVGFDLDKAEVWNLLETWATLAQQEECIAPVGSSRTNHRQDQAVFTILYYRYTGMHSLRDTYVSMATHQDCD
jgi:hypothetical protein